MIRSINLCSTVGYICVVASYACHGPCTCGRQQAVVADNTKHLTSCCFKLSCLLVWKVPFQTWLGLQRY